MGEEEKNPNPIYIVPDLREEILLRLPLKSILKFKAVSKQWRSILESKMFVERHMNNQKSRKILAAYNCDCGDRPSLLPKSRFEGDEEIVYLHCDAARPSMTCDGLVCFPEPDWVNVLNPSTRQLRRFPSGTVPVSSSLNRFRYNRVPWVTFFPGDRAMGFGRDKVTGSYKVVRMSFVPVVECEVLDVENGEWRKLSPPPYEVDVVRKSVCVNGSIYWLRIFWCFKILALDLHKEEFHNVSVPDTGVTPDTQLVNLEDRLAIAKTRGGTEWILEIMSMDAEAEIWSKAYSISLASLDFNLWESNLFTPVTISKLGNVVFCDNHKRLYSYHLKTDEICLISTDICVISPYLENLVTLRSHHPYPDYKIRTHRCRLFSKHPEPAFQIPKIVFTTLLVVGFILGYLSTSNLIFSLSLLYIIDAIGFLSICMPPCS